MIWPTSLPQLPTIAGYQESPVDTRLRTNVDAGLEKVRNRYLAAPINVTERYIITQTQLNTLRNFYKNDLGNGAERFLKSYPTAPIGGGEYQKREYRFISTINPKPFGIHFEVVLNLEILPE